MDITSFSNETEIIKNMPGYICVKNTDCRVIAITHQLALLTGWKNTEEVIGKIDYDLPSKACECADEYIMLDKLAMNSRKKIMALQIVCYEIGWRIFLTERTPFFDQINKLFKLYSYGMDITSPALLKGISLITHTKKSNNVCQLQQANYIIDEEYKPLTLTSKQELCLFYLIRGKTLKEIAHLLDVSPKTVQDHLDAIKLKLNCHSKSQLIEKALDSGFFYYIPTCLLKNIQGIYS